MMSLNRADALRRKLEEEHDFNAEQANGTLMVVDEMVDSGFDRMLKSIADLDSKIDTTATSLRSDMETGFALVRSEMDKSNESLRSELTKDIAFLRSELTKDIAFLRSELVEEIGSVRSVMDERFKATNRLFMVIQALVPFASAVITLGLLVALVNLGNSPQSVIWLI